MKFGNYDADSKAKASPEEMAALRGVVSGETYSMLANGRQWKFKFANGFGASVINDGYGRDSGLYELAVLDAEGSLTYDTPITDDVLGYLSPDEVGEALAKIEALPTVGA